MRAGNLVYYLAEGYKHGYGYTCEYIYNALQLFFRQERADEERTKAPEESAQSEDGAGTCGTGRMTLLKTKGGRNYFSRLFPAVLSAGQTGLVKFCNYSGFCSMSVFFDVCCGRHLVRTAGFTGVRCRCVFIWKTPAAPAQ